MIGSCFLGGLNVPPPDYTDGYGIKAVFYAARMGRDNLSMLDNAVDSAIGKGITPLIKIGANEVPADMDLLLDWTGDVVERFVDRVQHYALGNEVDNPREQWTAESYGDFRCRGYDIIKSAKPDAVVLDGGMTMGAYLADWANEIARDDPWEAISFLEQWGDAMQRRHHRAPTTVEGLLAWLSTPLNVKRLALVDELFTNGHFDALQFHYLQDAPGMLAFYMQRLQSKTSKLLAAWEIGFGWTGNKDGEPFDELDHARGLVTTLATCIAEGAMHTIQEPATESSYSVGRGLWTQDCVPRPAAIAYSVLADKIKGPAVRVGTSGVTIYRYGDVYVGWADTKVSVRAPKCIQPGFIKETNMLGTVSVNTGDFIMLGPEPKYWKFVAF